MTSDRIAFLNYYHIITLHLKNELTLEFIWCSGIP